MGNCALSRFIVERWVQRRCAYTYYYTDYCGRSSTGFGRVPERKEANKHRRFHENNNFREIGTHARSDPKNLSLNFWSKQQKQESRQRQLLLYLMRN